jgi:hypothetical protein
MNLLCALAAIGLLIGFTAVNLFLPYAILVLGAGMGAAVLLGIPCGLLDRDRSGECRLGSC